MMPPLGALTASLILCAPQLGACQPPVQTSLLNLPSQSLCPWPSQMLWQGMSLEELAPDCI